MRRSCQLCAHPWKIKYTAIKHFTMKITIQQNKHFSDFYHHLKIKWFPQNQVTTAQMDCHVRKSNETNLSPVHAPFAATRMDMQQSNSSPREKQPNGQSTLLILALACQECQCWLHCKATSRNSHHHTGWLFLLAVAQCGGCLYSCQCC